MTSTDLSKRLREVHGLHAFAELFGFSWEDESDWDWHDVACAMADAIDATVGVGTCKLVIEKRPRHGPWIYHFGCGYDFWQMTDCPMPILKHCPNCGKRIKVVSA